MQELNNCFNNFPVSSVNVHLGVYYYFAVNKNTCPGDKSALRPGGLRIGAPALTTRTMKEKDFEQVADFIDRGIKLGLEVQKLSGPEQKKFEEVLLGDQFKGKVEALKNEVEEFAIKFPMPGHDNI